MLKPYSEKMMARVLGFGAALTTLLVISSSVTDPVNAPKLVSLGGLALAALGILISNGNRIFFKESKIPLTLGAILLTAAFNAALFSESPLSQNIFGVYGRNNGLITYLFLGLVFVTATVLSAKASFETVVRSLLFAGLVNIAYCGWVILFGDFVGWSNPYGNILGTFGNPNFIGAFLGVFLSAYVAYALSPHVSKNWRWSLLAVVPITSVEIINSHAIQGRVVAAGGLALVAFSYLRHRLNKLVLGLYSIAVVILGLFATFGALQIGPLTQFIYKTSISLRGQYWLAGWNAGQTKPFTGVGMDSLGDWYRRTRDAKAIVLPGVDTVVNAAHNVFMDMFAFGGWPLLLAYTAMVAYVSVVLFRTFSRLKEFDGIFTALAVAWIGYQIQSIISINQIGLAIWGWLLGGALIAYERFTRDRDTTAISTENVNKGLRNSARRSSSAHESKTLLGASVFALVGILVSLPPLVSDSKWKSALNGQSVLAIEETMKTGFFNQQTVNKYVMNIKLLEDNKFPDLAHKYALQAVEWNPQSYDLWRFLYLITKTTQSERETALAKMKELDPPESGCGCNTMKVAIIGQGYVGLTISAFAAESCEVVGFDSNARIVEQLNDGISHIEGVENSHIRKLVKSGRYRATTIGSDIAHAEIVVIAVPTPLTKDRQPDLAFIDAACKTIGENIKKPVLVINESTSFPGTLRNYIKPAIEKYSKKTLEHLYAISPERVDPGRGDYNQKNTPRLYAGLTPEASEITRSFYSKFCDKLVEVSSPEVAEAAKLFENTFRQVNIALVNEFAQIANSLGISVYETLDAANTKPYGFMKFTPSAGVGGHCIPVDPTYLAAVAEEHGAPATFIRRANEVNLEMSKYVVDRVQADNGESLQGKSVLVVGVAYKPNVADVRETAAELVIEHLRNRGAVVSWHDDVVASWNGEKSSPLSGADIALVVTKHDDVKERDILASAPYVFDTTGKVAGAKGL